MTPGAIARVRDVLAGLDPTEWQTLAARALEAHSLTEVQSLLGERGV